MTRFIHLTDLHITHPDAGDPLFKPDNIETMREVVTLINAMDPQPLFVVASGDLTNMGDVPSYNLLQDLLAPLNAPLIMALGNHDKRAGFHQVFGNTGSDAPYFHDVVHGDLHVITLDTSVPEHVAGTIDDAQFDFLAAALSRHTELAKLVVMHHPPCLDPGAMPWGSIDMASTDRLVQALEGHNIVGILSGHIHINRISHWHGIPLVTTNGQDSTIDLLETSDLRILEGTGFGICDLRPSGLTVSFAPLSPKRRELAVVDQERLRTFI